MNKSLNTKCRFEDDTVESFKGRVDRGIYINKGIMYVPSVQYNRIKYNRMDGDEQKEYEKKLNTLKKVHCLYYDKDTWQRVSKQTYDYAQLPTVSDKTYPHK